MIVDFSKKSCLIVDENEFSRTFIKNSFSDIGFQTIKDASTIEEAINLLSTTSFDIISLEQKLNASSGVELAKEINSGKYLKNKNTHVIIISAESSSDVVKNAKDAGVSSYLLKPVSLETLKKRISFILKD
ncbi:MAG: response regulator [Alphaproteobacteria bacterium]